MGQPTQHQQWKPQNVTRGHPDLYDHMLVFGGCNTSCSKTAKIDGNMRRESEENLLLPLLKRPD